MPKYEPIPPIYGVVELHSKRCACHGYGFVKGSDGKNVVCKSLLVKVIRLEKWIDCGKPGTIEDYRCREMTKGLGPHPQGAGC